MGVVRKHRKRIGMTQAELAKHLRVSNQFICNHENGSAPFPSRLMGKCAVVLNIDVKLLVNERVRQFKREIEKDARISWYSV